jgi:cobalt/nickel transport system permease protein
MLAKGIGENLFQIQTMFNSIVRSIPRSLRLYYGLLVLWFLTTALHIPDGYLSPATSIILFIIVFPFWVVGVRKLREKMTYKNVPLVALFAAFSFVIMMFNVPLPGGTAGHAVGGALAAIILGPEIATLAISIALVIQALFFGDGGILAIGANCFNMAVVLPYFSFAIYQAFTKKKPISSKRRIIGAALGGWTGLTVAAFFAAVEFGIQPMLFHSADGMPLYAPYPLSVSIPAMVIPHALIASIVEGGITALVIAYLARTNQQALEIMNKPRALRELNGLAKWRGLWIGLASLVMLVPLGLLAPGTAWGEWGTEELSSLGLDFIPQGLAKLTNFWPAPLADYDVPALGNTNLGYILSAVVGTIIVTLVVWLFMMLLTLRKTEAR